MKKGIGVLIQRLVSIKSELYRYNRRADLPDDVKVCFGDAMKDIDVALEKLKY